MIVLLQLVAVPHMIVDPQAVSLTLTVVPHMIVEPQITP